MNPLRRIVAVVTGRPAAVVAAWEDLAAASPDPAPLSPSSSAAPSPGALVGGERRRLTPDGAPRCANCGGLFMPRPAGSPLLFRAHAEICRTCAGYPSIVLERGIAR